MPYFPPKNKAKTSNVDVHFPIPHGTHQAFLHRNANQNVTAGPEMGKERMRPISWSQTPDGPFFGIEERYWYWLALSSHRKGFIEADLHLDKYCLVLRGWELDKEMVVHARAIFLPCAVQGTGDSPTLHVTVIIHQHTPFFCTTKLGKQISRLDLYHMFTNVLLLLCCTGHGRLTSFTLHVIIRQHPPFTALQS